MSIWSRLFERRAAPTWNTRQGADAFTQLFGSGPTASGLTVTPEKALSVPAVFACLQVLAQDVGRTPIKFRRIVAADTLEDATDHPLWEILSSLPNPEMTAYQFKHEMQWQLVQFGRAYAEIVRDAGGVIAALWPLDSRLMRVDRDEQRRKRWTYSGGGRVTTWTFDASRPPVLELTHETPLHRCRDLIGLALALQTYQSKFFANGGRPTGVLQVAGTASETTLQRLREMWSNIYARPENAHQVAILDGGLEFKPIGFANNDSQMVETLAAINQMIAGVFRVPTWKVGDLTKATYSNMSAGEIAYVTSTLDPFYQSWEDAIRRDLLTTRQYTLYSAQFDRSALIRSDVQAQHQALSTGIQAGFYSQNDARRALGQNPIPDGDTYRINSALIPAAQPQTGEPHVA